MEYVIWGDIVFELLSYKEHREELSFPYAHHETILPPASLQWMGDKELRKVTVAVRLHNGFCEPLEEHEALIEQSSTGEAYNLIIAEQPLGEFALERLSSTIQQIDAWGKPVVIDLDLEFSEYIEKPLETKKIKTTQSKGNKAVKKQSQQEAKYKIVKVKNADGYETTRIERVQ
ncbi:phage tail protein [Thermodesulfovibrio thiophilus]|uniref:phage tail protein n=1 Tax=Thermodesulfovibrio thiophilus TaxID=340095 RepID=UPI0004093E95|nr:phage tail protein [Thermodesulfovibrio thiophilus]